MAAVPVTTRWTPLRITRHGDPIETRSLSRDSWCHMAGPPMASAAPAVAANPAASAASGGPVRRPAGRGRSTSATASPTPTSRSETLTANPSPTSTPASVARVREGTGARSPAHGPNSTATAATAKTTACPSTCAPAMSSCSSSGLAAQSRAARSWRAGSRRVMRCSSRAVPANAARLARPSTNTVSRAEVPPISAASPCTPVASGP